MGGASWCAAHASPDGSTTPEHAFSLARHGMGQPRCEASTRASAFTNVCVCIREHAGGRCQQACLLIAFGALCTRWCTCWCIVHTLLHAWMHSAHIDASCAHWCTRKCTHWCIVRSLVLTHLCTQCARVPRDRGLRVTHIAFLACTGHCFLHCFYCIFLGKRHTHTV